VKTLAQVRARGARYAPASRSRRPIGSDRLFSAALHHDSFFTVDHPTNGSLVEIAHASTPRTNSRTTPPRRRIRSWGPIRRRWMLT
jgi:hypothetical protein